MSHSTRSSSSPPKSLLTSTSSSTIPINGTSGFQKRDKYERGHLIGVSFSSALEALWANRLRSMLTSLGVIFGVAAVIAAVTLTQGASTLINDRLSRLGANVLTIYPGVAVSGGVSNAIGTKPTLTIEDAKYLSKIPGVAEVSPVLTVLPAQIVYGNQNWNTRVQGVFPDFQNIQNWQLVSGSWFSQNDNNTGASVAVIGSTVASNLFSGSGVDAVGRTIRISNENFRVIGVLQAKGSEGASNPDDIVYTPLQTAQVRLRNSSFVDYIQMQIDTAAAVSTVQRDATALLVTRHHIQAGQPNDFLISNANQLLQTSQQFSQALTFLLIGIAAISLTVGGIGIMNIMLVSVTERIHEIGIRMAVGARRGDIRNQFLIESLLLSMAGGIIGIILGLVVGEILIRWLSSTTSLQLPLILNPFSVLISFGISLSVGVAFGLYPAIRAAQLDPIVALRKD